jgi:hypothetical protein
VHEIERGEDQFDVPETGSYSLERCDFSVLILWEVKLMTHMSTVVVRAFVVLVCGLVQALLPSHAQTNALNGLYFRSNQAIFFSQDRWVSCIRDEGCSFGPYAVDGSKLLRESYSWWAKEDFKRSISFEMGSDKIKLGWLSFDKVELLPEQIPDPRKVKFFDAKEIGSRMVPGVVSTGQYESTYRLDGSYLAKDLKSLDSGSGTWAVDPAGYLRTENPRANRKFRYVFYEYNGVVYVNGERITSVVPLK